MYARSIRRRFVYSIIVVVACALAGISCSNTSPAAKDAQPEAGFNAKFTGLLQAITGADYTLADITSLMDANSCKPHQPNLWDTSVAATLAGSTAYINYCARTASKCNDTGTVSIDLVQTPATLSFNWLKKNLGAPRDVTGKAMETCFEFDFTNSATRKKATIVVFCGEPGKDTCASFHKVHVYTVR